LDVNDQKLPMDINKRDQIIAKAYEDYLSAALDEKAVIAVITWSLDDRHSWLADYFPRQDLQPVRTLPLDRNFNRKLAWNAIASAFDHAPKR
jgi:endo-1,4-beta-xylanase